MSSGAPDTFSTRRYAVFISYRHADNREAGRKWASWLHERLETFQVPSEYEGKLNQRGKLVPKSLYPVFRDEEELPADADLSNNIKLGLERSDLLVVLCSPRAVQSRYVAEEIRYFKELGHSDRVLALMIDGEPNAGDAAECLPEPLRYGVPRADGSVDWSVRTEPIAADARPGGRAEQGWTSVAQYGRELKKQQPTLSTQALREEVVDYEKRLNDAVLKIIAGGLGVPFGELTQRDQVRALAAAKKRGRVMMALAAVFGLLAIAAAGLAWLANENKKAALAANQLNQKNLHRASMADLSSAVVALEQNTQAERGGALSDGFDELTKWHEAIALAARALEREPKNELAAQWLYESLRLGIRARASKPLHSISLQEEPLSLEFSPDGRWVVLTLGREVQTGPLVFLRMPEEPSGEIREVAAFHAEGRVVHAAFSADGELMATGDVDGTIRLWSLDTGEKTGAVMKHEQMIVTLAFSPDGKRLLSSGSDHVSRMWSMPDGRELWKKKEEFSADAFRFSPDGSKFLQIEAAGKGTVLDTNTLAEVSRIDPGVFEELMSYLGLNGLRAEDVYFSPDGSQLLQHLPNHKVLRWEVATGKALGEPLTLKGALSADFSPEGMVMAVGSESGKVQALRLSNAKPFWERSSGSEVKSVHHGYTGELIAEGNLKGLARVWGLWSDSSTPQMLHEGPVKYVRLSPDEKILATLSVNPSGTSGALSLWSVLMPSATSQPVSLSSSKVEKSPDGRTVILREEVGKGGGELLQVLDTSNGTALGKGFQVEKTIGGMFFSPDGRKLVVETYPDDDMSNNSLQIYALPEGGKIGPPIALKQLFFHRVVFSPDGRQFASVSLEGVRVWDATTALEIGKAIRTPGVEFVEKLTGVPGSIDMPGFKQTTGMDDASLCADGKHIAVSDAKQISIMEITTGKRVGEPLLHGGQPPAEVLPGMMMSGRNRVYYSQDGRVLLTTAYHGGSVRVWDAATQKMLFELPESDRTWVSPRLDAKGERLLVGFASGEVEIWDVHAGKLASPIIDHGGVLGSVSFRADERWLLTVTGGPEDDTITSLVNEGDLAAAARIKEAFPCARLWDARSGLPLADRFPIGRTDKDVNVNAEAGSLLLLSGEKSRLWKLQGRHVRDQVGQITPEVITWAKAVAGLDFSVNGSFRLMSVAERARALAATKLPPGPWMLLSQHFAGTGGKEAAMLNLTEDPAHIALRMLRQPGANLTEVATFDPDSPLWRLQYARSLEAKANTTEGDPTVPSLAALMRWRGLELLRGMEGSLPAAELADQWLSTATALAEAPKTAKAGVTPTAKPVLEEALRAAEKALKLNPTLKQAHLTRAGVLNLLLRHQEALDAAEQAFVPGVVDYSAIRQKALALEGLQKQEEALPLWEQWIFGIEAGTATPNTYFLIATRAIRYGKPDLARRLTDAAIKHHGDKLDEKAKLSLYFRAGWTYLGLGESKAARAAFKVIYDPENSRGNTDSGLLSGTILALWLEGEEIQAVNEYLKLISMKPEWKMAETITTANWGAAELLKPRMEEVRRAAAAKFPSSFERAPAKP